MLHAMEKIASAQHGVRTHVLDAAGIAALDADAWDRLSASALCENPFYARQYVLAGLTTIDKAAGVKAVCVTDEHDELIGLFPYRSRIVPPLAWSVALSAANLYQFSGHPLVARDRAAEVVGVWLDTVAAGTTPRFWMFSHFDLDGPLRRLIDSACTDRTMSTAVAMPYERAYLTRIADDFTAHCARVIPKKRLKDIQRNLRRLNECGDLTFERASDPVEVRQRLEQFFVLEAAGWKGDYGTAFLSAKDHELFARQAFGDMSNGQARCVIDSLLLDGEPVAMSINISSGSVAFTPKCAYHERWRRYGPGLILEYLVVERFYAEREFTEMDAATIAVGHVVRDLWGAEKTMGCLIVGPANWRTRMLAACRTKAQRYKRLAGRMLGRR